MKIILWKDTLSETVASQDATNISTVYFINGFQSYAWGDHSWKQKKGNVHGDLIVELSVKYISKDEIDVITFQKV